MTRDERSTRAHALELASRHGLPPNMTMSAARLYLSFLNGNDPAEWTAERASEALVTHLAGIGKGVAKKAPPKKAAPRKRAA